jgi:hypothetical protein
VEEVPGLRFHDIKPLPEFTPESALLPAVLTALTVAAVLFVLRAWLKSRRTKEEARRVPDEAAIAALRQLEADTPRIADIRERGQLLSSVFRTFLEEAIGFPAREQTKREVERSLKRVFAKHMPLVPAENKERALGRISGILHVAEELAFRHDSERAGDSLHPRIAEKCREAAELVVELSAWIRKEKERTADVSMPDASPFPFLIETARTASPARKRK